MPLVLIIRIVETIYCEKGNAMLWSDPCGDPPRARGHLARASAGDNRRSAGLDSGK